MYKIVKKETYPVKDTSEVISGMFYSAEIGNTSAVVIYDNTNAVWRVAPVVTSGNSFIKGYFLNEFDKKEIKEVVTLLVEKGWTVMEHESVEEMFIYVCRGKLSEYY